MSRRQQRAAGKPSPTKDIPLHADPSTIPAASAVSAHADVSLWPPAPGSWEEHVLDWFEQADTTLPSNGASVSTRS